MIMQLLVATIVNQAAAEPNYAWLNLGEPTVQETSLRVPVGAPEWTLEQATCVTNGAWVVVYVPSVRAVKRSLRFESGPATVLRVKPVAHGSVMMFRPRAGTPAELLKRLQVRKGAVTFGSIGAVASAGNDTVGTTDAVVASSATAPQPAALEFNLPKESVLPRPAPPAASERAAPRTLTSAEPTSGGGLRLAAALMVVLAAALAAMWWRKRRAGPDAGDPSIDVVAVRSIGGKYKLVLVDACGERMLLAATDKEVHMLKSLDASPEDQPSASADFASALNQRNDGLTDVEGLLRLRDNRRRSTVQLDGVAA